MQSPLFFILSFLAIHTATAADVSFSITNSLGPLLSPAASIIHNTSAVPRWSLFERPNPGAVVNVATENDVLVAVQYCNKHNIPYLAQNGGNGWATTFHLDQFGVLINLSGIKQIAFNAQKTEVTFQGGALIQDIVAAAYANNTQVPTGNCNCVGMLGAVLGGGYGHLLGQYGFGVDNVLSLNLVTAAGTSIMVTPSDTDLWWALRGAGPNFGIVTSVTMKAYPASQDTAWTGIMTFTEDKIETLVQAINDLVLEPKMNIFFYYTTLGPPAYSPVVAALPFYHGNETAGKAAFASIYALGPTSDATSVRPYGEWNKDGDTFCIKGGRKPSYGAGMANMVPVTWRAIWNEYIAFLANNGTGNSLVLLESYSLFKARSIPDSTSSFPFRSTVNYNGVAIAWYQDPSLDAKAEAWGSKVRDLWRETDHLAANSTYINFAFGDESLPTVYGNNTARLQKIKAYYDPQGRFDQWFPLSKIHQRVQG